MIYELSKCKVCGSEELTKVDKEIDNRLAKANSSFGRLYKCVWKNKQYTVNSVQYYSITENDYIKKFLNNFKIIVPVT